MANSRARGVSYEDPAISGGTIDDTPIGATTKSTGAFTTLSSTGTTTLGDAAADLISFHGATAVDQAAVQTCVSTSAAVSVCGAFAFTSAQANALITNVNALLDLVKEKGLMALA